MSENGLSFSSPVLVLATSYTLFLPPLLFSLFLLPAHRSHSSTTPILPAPRFGALERVTLLLAAASLALAGIAGAISVPHPGGAARDAGVVFEVVSAFLLNLYLYFQVAKLSLKLYWASIALLSLLLITTTTLHIVFLSENPSSRVLPILHGLFSVAFDLTLFSIFLQSVLSTTFYDYHHSFSPTEMTSTTTAANRFSNPWRPSTPPDRLFHGEISWSLRFRLRSFRLALACLVSVATWIVALVLQPRHDYGDGAHVVPTLLGTTPSPGGFLIVTLGVLIRILGVEMDLIIPNSQPQEMEAPPAMSRDRHPSSPKPVAVEMRSFDLSRSRRVSSSVSSSSTRQHSQRRVNIAPPHLPFGVIRGMSATRSGGPTTNNASYEQQKQFPNQQSINSSIRDNNSEGGRWSINKISSESRNSEAFVSPRLSSSPPRISTPPILKGLGLTSLGFPSGTASSPSIREKEHPSPHHQHHRSTSPPPSSPTSSPSKSSWGKKDKSSTNRSRPSLSHLQLSFDGSNDFTTAIDRERSGTFTPPGSSSGAMTPKTRAFRSGSSTIEIDVEGGDPFARDLSLEAKEVWLRNLRERMEAEVRDEDSPEFAAEDTGGGERFGDIQEESDEDEEAGIAEGGELGTGEPSFIQRFDENTTPSPVSSMLVRVIAPTPVDSPSRSTPSRQRQHVPAPPYQQQQSGFVDPFPAPSSSSSHSQHSIHSVHSLQQQQNTIPFPLARPLYPRAHQSAPPPNSSPQPASPSSSLATFALNRLRNKVRPTHGSRDSAASDESFYCKGDRDVAFQSHSRVGPSWEGPTQEEILVEASERDSMDIAEVVNARVGSMKSDRSSSRASHDQPTLSYRHSGGLKPLRLPELVESQSSSPSSMDPPLPSPSTSIKMAEAQTKKKEKWSWWPLAAPSTSGTSFLPRTSTPTQTPTKIRRVSSTPAFRQPPISSIPARAPSQLGQYSHHQSSPPDPYALFDSPGSPILTFSSDSRRIELASQSYRARYRGEGEPVRRGRKGGQYGSTPPLSAISNFSMDNSLEVEMEDQSRIDRRSGMLEEGEGDISTDNFADDSLDNVLTWATHPRETTVSSSNSGFSALRSSFSAGRGGEHNPSSFYSKEVKMVEEAEEPTSGEGRTSFDSGLSMARLIARDAHSFGIAGTPPSSAISSTFAQSQSQASSSDTPTSSNTQFAFHPLSPFSPAMTSSTSSSPTSPVFDSPMPGKTHHRGGHWGSLSTPHTPDSSFVAEDSAEMDPVKEEGDEA